MSKKGNIIISKQAVIIQSVNASVWMTSYQIAELFGVFISTVNSNIKSIFKSSQLDSEKACCFQQDEKSITQWYSIDVIVALAFRLSSDKAILFREWIIKSIVFFPFSIGNILQNFSLN